VQTGTSILLTRTADEPTPSRLLVPTTAAVAEGTPRALIAEHLEPEVVEVYGAGALALAHDATLQALAARTEVSGETVFFYTRAARPLLDALLQHPHLRTLHRPANLEDLFLKLTGRQIREDG
jgi:lipooligosaccharide transport system ATP-binding protein